MFSQFTFSTINVTRLRGKERDRALQQMKSCSMDNYQLEGRTFCTFFATIWPISTIGPVTSYTCQEANNDPWSEKDLFYLNVFKGKPFNDMISIDTFKTGKLGKRTEHAVIWFPAPKATTATLAELTAPPNTIPPEKSALVAYSNWFTELFPPRVFRMPLLHLKAITAIRPIMTEDEVRAPARPALA